LIVSSAQAERGIFGSWRGTVKSGATIFTPEEPEFYKAGKACANNLLRFFPRVVAAAEGRRYNKDVPRENTKRKKEPGKYDPDMVMEENIMKKITRRSFLAVCGAAAAAAALTACGGSASSAAASSAASTASGSLSGNVTTGGSTSMKNVIAALTEGFAEVEPGVTVSYDPTGSGAGITGATDKTLDIGLSSRALKDDEKNDVDGTIIALDGIAIIVNKASKVEDLTVDQLQQMFTGEITNWSEVGGDDGEIVLIGREAGSGTRDGFESIVDVKDSCKYAQELTATGAVISAVEANPLAIGYASLSAVGETVKMVTVGGVACSEETVKDGSYEVQRPFVFVTNKSVTLSEQAQAFFDFATSADAADLIRTAGAVPVNE
jgi:phosphate transport system substrate-binding protein